MSGKVVTFEKLEVGAKFTIVRDPGKQEHLEGVWVKEDGTMFNARRDGQQYDKWPYQARVGALVTVRPV